MSAFHVKNNSVARAPRKAVVRDLSGSVHFVLVGVLAVLFISGGCYLYSVNQSATHGYHMRSLEKEIATLTQENAELRIVEADLRALNRIEEVTSRELGMQKSDTIKYRQEDNAVTPVVSRENRPVAMW